MITEKIKSLFAFIEFLHSNIDNFKKYEEELNESVTLSNERRTLRPESSFEDAIKDKELKRKLFDKLDVIEENITKVILSKGAELFIINPNKHNELLIYSGDIDELKQNVSVDDRLEILKHKDKYIEFRTQFNVSLLITGFVFIDLNKLLINLFGYFDSNSTTELEAFEPKANPTQKPDEPKPGRPKGELKEFRMMIFASKRIKFDERAETIKSKYKDHVGQTLAYVCLALVELEYLNDTAFKNKSSLYRSFGMGFLGKAKDDRGFSEYLKPEKKVEDKYETILADVKEILL